MDETEKRKWMIRDFAIRNNKYISLSKKIGSKCWYCGTSLTIKTCELDHIVPKARGGPDTISNLALSCKPCNRAKWDLHLSEFLQWLKRPKNTADHILKRARSSEEQWLKYGEAIEKGFRQSP